MVHRADVITAVTRFNRGRDPERLALKYKAMQKDALGFFRGSCHVFYSDWPVASKLNRAPTVWVCGDLHIENFGTYRGDNRLVYFDIADFDDSYLAPCTWDVARVVTSVLIAAKVHDLPRQGALQLSSVLLDAYTLALRDGKARWIERATAQGLVQSLLRRLERGTQSTFIKQRTERRKGHLRLRIDGKHTLKAAAKDRERVERFMRTFAKGQPYPALFEVLDVARRIAGTGSLGLERYTILVAGGGTPVTQVLLDLKYAAPSVLSGHTKPRPPWENDAERIVAIERRMQAISPALLHAVVIDSKPYVLRELMPSQDKLSLGSWTGRDEGIDLLARDLGYLLAWSELRSSGRNGSATIDELIEFAHQNRWRHSIVEYAKEYRETAWRDWKRFRQAYRDQALPTA